MDIKEIARDIYKGFEREEYSIKEIENALENPSNIFTGNNFLSFFFFDFLTKEQAKEVKKVIKEKFRGREKISFKEIEDIVFSIN